MVVTFLPYADFDASARTLSNRHLGKQRVEAAQILKALETGAGWSKHPATLAWCGHTEALRAYLKSMITEWISRGFKNTIPIPEIDGDWDAPWWLGWDTYHYSHQMMLLRKNPAHYQQYFTDVPEEYLNYGYVWPAKLKPKDKSRPLAEIASPVPESLIDPIYCPRVTRKGEPCGILVKNRELGVCGIHRPR